MLCSFPGELGRVPCFQGQLNSPRNPTHNFHLTHYFFAAGNRAGLGGLLASLCFYTATQTPSGNDASHPKCKPCTIGQRNAHLTNRRIFHQGRQSISDHFIWNNSLVQL